MSFRSFLPVVAILTLGVALPAFPCDGNPNCGCNMKAGKAADPKACDGKCDHAQCAKKAGAAKAEAQGEKAVKGAKVIELSVTEDGFEPASVKVAKGVPVKLVITRKTEATCAKQIVVKDYGINTELPLNKAVEVSLTPKAAGTIKYGCAMGMMISGVLVVE
ncbi:MAG: cupredoxin domain-containing protein [Myxococcaceae bacterium]